MHTSLPYILCLLALTLAPSSSTIDPLTDPSPDPYSPPIGTNPPKSNKYGNIPFSNLQDILYPEDEHAVKKLLKARQKLHVIGSLFSVSGVANSSSKLVSLQKFKNIECCQGQTIYIGAGVTYKELLVELKKYRLSLTSIPINLDMNVVSSIVTGQHGSGFQEKSFANQVQEFTLIRADGTQRVWHNQTQEFDTMLVGLGYLGIVTGLRLHVVKQYDLRKCIYQDIPYSKFTRRLYEMFFGKFSATFYSDLSEMKFNSAWFNYKIEDQNQGMGSGFSFSLHTLFISFQSRPK